jgi:glutathione S-transferase
MSQRMKLHWSPSSPYVRKVMIVAHETGLLDQLELVRSVVSMTVPNMAVMADNPLGKLPTLVTETGAIFDSRVICEYLDTLHAGPRLFPQVHAQRLQALRWQALGDGVLDVAILWRNERIKPAERRTPEWLSGFELKMGASLASIERDIGKLEQLPFGVGQIAIACALGYLDFRFADLAWRQQHPWTARWFERISQRESLQKTTAPPATEP